MAIANAPRKARHILRAHRHSDFVAQVLCVDTVHPVSLSKGLALCAAVAMTFTISACSNPTDAQLGSKSSLFPSSESTEPSSSSATASPTPSSNEGEDLENSDSMSESPFQMVTENMKRKGFEDV